MIKKLWFLSLALLIIHLIIQYVFYLNIQFKTKEDWIYFIVDLNGNMFATYLGAGVLGSLLALVPFRGKKYIEKLKITIPLSASSILFLAIISFGYFIVFANQKGYLRRDMEHYENIQPKGVFDCSSFHTGIFETEGTRIERKANKQLETDHKTGKIHELDIQWVNDCEYTLTTPGDSLNIISVKITEVTADSYKCYASSKAFRDAPAMFFEVKRVKNKLSLEK